ncbi:murein transglycosylase A [Halocynthiibacter namhaensis]|uniref:murein transglycosylase A n=1 Tax=Halocynthiibacter namhaensis TaxID=1290553 RepID=UPI00068F59A6|nr:MltA domain-containing protein [Halocynthiibacter namhaensis]
MTAQSEERYSLLPFNQLDGWQEDNHAEAFSAFLETCGDLKDPEWKAICALAKSRPMDQSSAQTFFEMFFRPVLIEDGEPMLFTGYFEPELSGSRARTGRFRFPIYSLPRDNSVRRLSRRQLEETGALNGRGLEICWVDDSVELFFLQIQGSGRVRLTDGSVLRVGYAGANGHEYRSIGQELIRRGIYNRHQVSAGVIANWVRRNPVDGAELLRHNGSFVYFRELRHVPSHKGPLGAMNRSVTTMRTVAVDRRYTPLGAPVWIEKEGGDPLRRLMVAQDTGSAIKGAQRADIFYGSGDLAGRAAGQVRDRGRMVVLLPITLAFQKVPEGDI